MSTRSSRVYQIRWGAVLGTLLIVLLVLALGYVGAMYAEWWPGPVSP